MFFDRYPRFYETGQVGAFRGRPNLRYEAIFTQNRDLFDGARVLDIACHDGRWSFAALQTGAAEVVGIEARPDLVEDARGNLSHYEVAPDRYRFIHGDIFEALANEDIGDIDVVMCLGFLYHTLRYPELLRGIRDLNPSHVIIDATVNRAPNAVVLLHEEKRPDKASNAVTDRYSPEESVLVGKPSASAIECMMEAYDFEVEQYSDWAALFRDNPDIKAGKDYRRGERVTIRFRDRAKNVSRR